MLLLLLLAMQCQDSAPPQASLSRVSAPITRGFNFKLFAAL